MPVGCWVAFIVAGDPHPSSSPRPLTPLPQFPRYLRVNTLRSEDSAVVEALSKLKDTTGAPVVPLPDDTVEHLCVWPTSRRLPFHTPRAYVPRVWGCVAHVVHRPHVCRFTVPSSVDLHAHPLVADGSIILQVWMALGVARC